MIKNLPLEFPVSALELFDFGSAEAKDDQLLTSCPVPTSAMSAILDGAKDIVLGYRGTGKSATVRLLSEKKLIFKLPEGWNSHLVVLDEELDYKTIREHLYKRATDDRSRALVSRVVWEILIIYRALQSIRELTGDSDPTIREFIKDIDVLLGVSTRRPSLIEIILSHKKRVGVKLDTNLPNIIDLYAGLEPNSSIALPEENTILKLADYKKYLNSFLQKSQITLFVLFDRLDDFVVQEDYATQKTLLHGLLATQVNYREKYPNIKIKAFLRTDLFQRIDLNEFGPDKILARSVELKWSPSEIKHFLGKRIAHNLIRGLKLPSLEIAVDRDTLHVSSNELATLEETKLTLSNFSFFKLSHWRRLFWYAGVRARHNSGEGRIRHSIDAFSEALITSIFPREISYKNVNGTFSDIKFLDFLDTHFQLSHGHCTPRALLSFLNHTLQCVRQYYDQNSDLRSVKRDARLEYPIFVKSAIREAYKKCCNEAWEVQYHWSKDMKHLVAELQKLATKKLFSFSDFQKATRISENEARSFLAFAMQTGLIMCANQREKYSNRIYRFPLLFQYPLDKSFGDLTENSENQGRFTF